jgi:hypothetical protein
MNTRLNAYLALTVGTGIGMLLAVGSQKLINQYYTKHCPQKADHQLVMITSFLGDAYYCIHKRDL